MKVIERLTAAEIQLRSPPRIKSAAWNHSLQRKNSACLGTLRISLALHQTDLLLQPLQRQPSRCFSTV